MKMFDLSFNDKKERIICNTIADEIKVHNEERKGFKVLWGKLLLMKKVLWFILKH
jgi:hypothetical protein